MTTIMGRYPSDTSYVARTIWEMYLRHRQVAVATTLDTSSVGHGFVDIVVGRNGVNYCLEIKTAKGRLNARQVDWHSLWRGQKAVVTTVEQTFAVIGIEDVSNHV